MRTLTFDSFSHWLFALIARHPELFTPGAALPSTRHYSLSHQPRLTSFFRFRVTETASSNGREAVQCVTVRERGTRSQG